MLDGLLHYETVTSYNRQPREVQRFEEPCALCGSTGVYLDEIVTDDKGGRMFVCSDSDLCEEQRAGQPVDA